jgi:hypothetical protein
MLLSDHGAASLPDHFLLSTVTALSKKNRTETGGASRKRQRWSMASLVLACWRIAAHPPVPSGCHGHDLTDIHVALDGYELHVNSGALQWVETFLRACPALQGLGEATCLLCMLGAV